MPMGLYSGKKKKGGGGLIYEEKIAIVVNIPCNKIHIVVNL
jgi:hypothetical protein